MLPVASPDNHRNQKALRTPCDAHDSTNSFSQYVDARSLDSEGNNDIGGLKLIPNS